ncbi:MAG: ribosome silencing factor [Elusimicrobia bacterium]|nr:ribosome silencing factor [Elusimicrobiota bacterium]
MVQVIDYRKTSINAVAFMEDKKAEDILLFDLRGLTSFTDYMIIATVNSTPQMEAVIQELKNGLDIRVSHVEGPSGGGWALMDYGGLVINIFYPKEREFYSLERIWGDAEKVST